jgi:hypothetical protein
VPRRTGRPPTSRGRLASLAPAVAAVAAYSWWATDLRAFTTLSTVAVAIPVALVAAATFALDHHTSLPSAPVGVTPPEMSRSGLLPWIVLLVVACGLEAAGLALGGRSPTVPTLSSVVDKTLVWHITRFGLFVGWLAWGGAPILVRVTSWVSRSAAGGVS